MDSPASRLEHNEHIFQSLLTLVAPDYLRFLKSASREELPAPVLARGYRRFHPSDPAGATLARLVDIRDPHRYLVSLRAAARHRRSRLGAYTPEDLVSNTIGDVVMTLAGRNGKLAETAWSLYLQRCMEDAYRALVGRDGMKLGSHAASMASESDVAESMERVAALWHDWRTRLDPDRLEWLERFIERTFAAIQDEPMRVVAFDLFSDTPMAVTSRDPTDPATLTGRLGMTRYSVYRLQHAARVLLYDALTQQTECEIDMSILTFTP